MPWVNVEDVLETEIKTGQEVFPGYDYYPFPYNPWGDEQDLEGLRKRWKKIRRKIKKVKTKLTPKFLRKPLARLRSARKRIHRKGREIGRKYVAPYVVPIAGALLAPVTGGASVIAAGLITTAAKAGQQRKDAKAAYRKAKKREAAAAIKAAQETEAAMDLQIAQFYNQHEQSHFVPAGYNRSRWNNMTREQRLSLIDQLAKGTVRAVAPGQAPSTRPAQYPPRIKADPVDISCATPAPTSLPGPGMKWFCAQGKWVRVKTRIGAPTPTQYASVSEAPPAPVATFTPSGPGGRLPSVEPVGFQEGRIPAGYQRPGIDTGTIALVVAVGLGIVLLTRR